MQYSYAGTATDRPLMQWLDHYTFPREAQMQVLCQLQLRVTICTIWLPCCFNACPQLLAFYTE